MIPSFSIRSFSSATILHHFAVPARNKRWDIDIRWASRPGYRAAGFAWFQLGFQFPFFAVASGFGGKNPERFGI
jgi:hypothetical protein